MGQLQVKCGTCSSGLEWGSRGSDRGEFEIPHSIAIDSLGNLFVTDSANDRIQKFTSKGTFLMQFGNKTALSSRS
jgi:hypothetical protein